MKILELYVKEFRIAVLVPEDLYKYIYSLHDGFLDDPEEMALLGMVYPEWGPWLEDQIKKQVEMQIASGQKL